MATLKPQDEIVVKFSKDDAGNIIIVFYEAHGAFVQTLTDAKLPTRATGKHAIAKTGAVGEFIKGLGLVWHSFSTRTGGAYYSYHALIAGL